MSADGITLRATDLQSKWGFGDGDIVDEWWIDHFDEYLEADGDLSLHHRALKLLVRRHLLPLIEGDPEVYEIETIHNPIRSERLDLPDVAVALTTRQVLSAIDAARKDGTA